MLGRCRFWFTPLLLAAGFALADASRAEEVGAEAPAAEPTPAPPAPSSEKPLDLDRLLRPRGAAPAPSGQVYGGRDRAEWEEQFKKARAEVVDLEGKVDFNQDRLRQAAAGDWNYSPAGGEAVDPEVLKLRAQLRRDRQSLEAARQRLRDLQVEASLAGVPEEWRGLP